MARVKMKMTAHGVEPPCTGCEKPFDRGSQMTAIEFDDGEPAGWYCEACMDRYKKVGFCIRLKKTAPPDAGGAA